MKYAVTMPSLGADMDQGKLLEWLVQPGQTIARGTPVAVVETQKAAVEIESFRDGTLNEYVAEVGQVLPVGAVLAWMEVADDGTAPGPAAPAPAAAPAVPAPTARPAPIAPAPVATGHRLRVSPAARRLAEKHGLDLAQLTGTGHEGAIELQDVEAALAAREAPAASGASAAAPATAVAEAPTAASLINIREAIARAMSRSKREIPHYYLQSRCQVDALLTWLDARNASVAPGERLFLPAVLMYAVVQVLRQHPQLNGWYEQGRFQPAAAIHLGVTVALKPDGVMVPAILDAQALDLPALNAAFNDLVRRTRAGKLRNREMTDGTVTVTNVGELGADQVLGVIFPPQVALFGFGRLHKVPVVDADGGLRPGRVLDISLAADHRVTDGLAGSRCLQALLRLLEDPRLLEETRP